MPGQPSDNMEAFLGVPERVAELIVRYIDGNLSDVELAELREALKQSAAARDLFVQWGLQTQALAEALVPQYSEADEPISFEQLAQMEAQATAELVHLDPRASKRALRHKGQKENQDALSMQDFVNAGSYLIHHAIRSKAAVVGAIVAILVLGFVLTMTLIGPGDDTPEAPGVADNTNTKPAESAPPIPRDTPGTNAVATLTASHNATWAEGASAPGSLTPGSKLHPNQRLTLTAGFAEITTNDGAIAILEAPATVELIDNNNALRLHAGKLVGICETESSKGLLVRTPHMDITDLGTSFGVDANTWVTDVQVFEGEVQAARLDTPTSTKPTMLTAKQAARTSANTNLITRIDYDADSFAAMLLKFIELPGTGQGLSRGDIDPNWQIVAYNGKTLDQPMPLAVGGFRGQLDAAPDAPTAAQWLTLKSLSFPKGQKTSEYVFQTTLTIPDAIDPDAFQLVMRATADNRILSVRVDQTTIDLDARQAEQEDGLFPPPAEYVLDVPLVPGPNTIQITVRAGPDVDAAAVDDQTGRTDPWCSGGLHRLPATADP